MEKLFIENDFEIIQKIYNHGILIKWTLFYYVRVVELIEKTPTVETVSNIDSFIKACSHVSIKFDE